MNECQKRGHRVIKMICDECGQEINRATFKAPDGWISVNEKYPEIGQKVLVTDGDMTDIGWITTQESWHSDDPDLCTITHWMPIFPLPRESPQ